MGVFPGSQFTSSPTVSPYSGAQSIGTGLIAVAAGIDAVASAVWPSANLALYIPILLGERITVDRFFTHNGTAVGNNLDIGLYTEDGVRVISTGSVAQSGTSVIQTYDVTDTPVGPGMFYLAISCNGTTSTLFVGAPSAELLRAMGCFQQASAFALPATATFAAMGQAYVPNFGLCTRSVI